MQGYTCQMLRICFKISLSILFLYHITLNNMCIHIYYRPRWAYPYVQDNVGLHYLDDMIVEVSSALKSSDKNTILTVERNFEKEDTTDHYEQIILFP